MGFFYLEFSDSRIKDNHRYDHNNTEGSPDPFDTLLVFTRENIHTL